MIHFIWGHFRASGRGSSINELVETHGKVMELKNQIVQPCRPSEILISNVQGRFGIRGI